MPLYYPKRNIVSVAPVWQLRRLSQIQMVDLIEHPLPISDFLRRPLVRRGRWIVRAYDQDARAFRQFYANAFRHTFREPPLRIGYRNENNKLVPISDPFRATAEGQRELAMVLHQLKRRPSIFVYCDDLRILRAG